MSLPVGSAYQVVGANSGATALTNLTVAGTANQIVVTPSGTTITLSLPQSIHTTANVTLGSITFSPTTSGIVGTTTNDNAASGKVGEYIASLISTPTNFPTSNNYGDLTSITLTAGDWDVTGVWSVAANGATPSFYILGITITSGNSGTGISSGDNTVVSATITDTTYSVPAYRLSVSGSMIVYLKYRAGYTGGPPQATGRLSARRVR